MLRGNGMDARIKSGHDEVAVWTPAQRPMKIATWNINGIKARIDAALTWLKQASPDIACLQEIKCVDEAFPQLRVRGARL